MNMWRKNNEVGVEGMSVGIEGMGEGMGYIAIQLELVYDI